MQVSLVKTSSTKRHPILCVRVRQHHSSENPGIGAADEVFTRDTILTRLGYDLLEAVDGTEALSLLAASRKIDLLFTDVVLPGGMNGIQLARAAQARFPALKVLCTSGYTDATTLDANPDHAEFAFVKKPFVRDELAGMVRRALDAERS